MKTEKSIIHFYQIKNKPFIHYQFIIWILSHYSKKQEKSKTVPISYKANLRSFSRKFHQDNTDHFLNTTSSLDLLREYVQSIKRSGMISRGTFGRSLLTANKNGSTSFRVGIATRSKTMRHLLHFCRTFIFSLTKTMIKYTTDFLKRN